LSGILATNALHTYSPYFQYQFRTYFLAKNKMPFCIILGNKATNINAFTFTYILLSYRTCIVTFDLLANFCCTASTNKAGVSLFDGISIRWRAQFCPSAFILPLVHDFFALELKNIKVMDKKVV
jgi:hypothetical protein